MGVLLGGVLSVLSAGNAVSAGGIPNVEKSRSSMRGGEVMVGDSVSGGSWGVASSKPVGKDAKLGSKDGKGVLV